MTLSGVCQGFLSFSVIARAFCLTSSSESSEVQDFLPGRSFVDANGRPADTRVKVTRGDSTLPRFNVFNSLNKHESKHDIVTDIYIYIYHDIMRWFESFEHESAVVFFKSASVPDSLRIVMSSKAIGHYETLLCRQTLVLLLYLSHWNSCRPLQYMN